ncbi:MAG: hypothetical protein FWC95_00175 [Defluviitaleaceae bacterium]|nr:hypothetical protein [Defluviitaleaceae bacterium]
MNSKRAKIIVDICMVIFMVLSFIRWEESNFAFHAIVGIGCMLFFATHVFIHRKWIKAVTKSCFAGKIKKALRGKYIINMLLLLVWGVCITAGFVTIPPFLSDAGSGFWSALHGVTARVGLGLVVIHIVQHIPVIKSYFGVKKKAQP